MNRIIYKVIVILTVMGTSIFPQVQFIQHQVTNTATNVEEMYAADIDGDGDIDVLSAKPIADEVTWYENDGNENFTAIVISTEADGPNDVYAYDMDGDGDMDVLSVSREDDEVAWYENDGSQNFTYHLILTYVYAVIQYSRLISTVTATPT